MPVENQSRVIYGQTYVGKNPDDTKGPTVWRLCVPGEESCGEGGAVSPLGTIIGVPPMTVANTYERLTVGFDIQSLAEINTTKLQLEGRRVLNVTLENYEKLEEKIQDAIDFNIFTLVFTVPKANELAAVAPMQIDEFGDNTVISHSINNLGDARSAISLTIPSRVLNSLENTYNINSATTKVEVVANSPVVVTVSGDRATFTMDYSQLSDA